MRVLGIDPGSHRTGWGVVDVAGSRLLHVASGTIHAGAGELAVRLVRIADALDELLTRHQPAAVAVERVFHAKNADSALKLGHARGVALLSVARASLPLFEYSASEIKQAVSGRGRASKDQVAQMVVLLLGLGNGTPAGLDTTDALAAAVCHAQRAMTPTATWLREQAAEGRR